MTCSLFCVTTYTIYSRRQPHRQYDLDSAVMSTTPNEKANAPLGAYALPDEKKIAAHSIGSDSDDSHQYGTGDVFAQGGQTQYYEPIAEYEGRHRYDPTATWSEAEEKKLIRRVSAGRLC